MNKPKALIFGAGAKGRSLLPDIQKHYEVIGFIDNDKTKWGETVPTSATNAAEVPISNPSAINVINYDTIVIGTYVGLEPMTEQLLNMGVSRAKIDRSYVAAAIESRIMFLERVGQIFSENNISGSVAEGGVFQGEFAKEINRVFPSSTLYLFDTFEGFDKRDTDIEAEREFSQSAAGHFNITNEELVLNKMPHREKCIIRKGFFPETAAGIDDRFCFVNLDFDLYQPILAGLDFFVPRMVSGGIVLIDDYFAEGYKGVKQAVADFEGKSGKLRLFPVGDGNSIGVLCP